MVRENFSAFEDFRDQFSVASVVGYHQSSPPVLDMFQSADKLFSQSKFLLLNESDGNQVFQFSFIFTFLSLHCYIVISIDPFVEPSSVNKLRSASLSRTYKPNFHFKECKWDFVILLSVFQYSLAKSSGQALHNFGLSSYLAIQTRLRVYILVGGLKG